MPGVRNHEITLSEFALMCKSYLEQNEQNVACSKICGFMRKALLNQRFLKHCFGNANWTGRKVLYEDDQLGFCILGHINSGLKSVAPHNHGPTWAIYGQAAGQTVMTEWESVLSGQKATVNKVKEIKTYTLNPGDVNYYPAGSIHSVIRREQGRLLRLEGQNIDRVGKQFFEPV